MAINFDLGMEFRVLLALVYSFSFLLGSTRTDIVALLIEYGNTCFFFLC